MPLILWSSKAGENISETDDVQDRNLYTEQRKEVREHCLGWEERVDYIKETFFPNTFLKSPKQKLKTSISKSDWIFLLYFLSEIFCFILISLTE